MPLTSNFVFAVIVIALLNIIETKGSDDCYECPYPYRLLPNTGICYKEFNSPKRTFQEARDFCANKEPGGSLLQVLYADQVLAHILTYSTGYWGILRIEGYEGFVGGTKLWLQNNGDPIGVLLPTLSSIRTDGKLGTLTVKPVSSTVHGNQLKGTPLKHICQVAATDICNLCPTPMSIQDSPTGMFNSPRGPAEGYPRNQTCVYTFEGDGSYVLKVSGLYELPLIDELTGSCSDTLEVFTGLSELDPTLSGPLCGGAFLHDMFVQPNEAGKLIRFNSDGQEQDFLAHFQMETETIRCGQRIDLMNNVEYNLISPSFTAADIASEGGKCEWLICAPLLYLVSAVFNNPIDLCGTPTNHDLEVYEGSSSLFLTGRTDFNCGDPTHNIVTCVDQCMFIRYSFATGSTAPTPLNITFSQVAALSVEKECELPFQLTAMPGVPGYINMPTNGLEGYQYFANAECIWVITPYNPILQVAVTFELFVLDSIGHCQNDVVFVHDGAENDPLLDEFFECIPPPSGPMISTQNMITIVFESDEEWEDTGFSISYQTVSTGLWINPTSDSGDCAWLSGPSGTSIQCANDEILLGTCETSIQGGCSGSDRELLCCQSALTTTDCSTYSGVSGQNLNCVALAQTNQTFAHGYCGTTGPGSDCGGDQVQLTCCHKHTSVPLSGNLHGAGSCYWKYGLDGQRLICDTNTQSVFGVCDSSSGMDCNQGNGVHGIYCCETMEMNPV